MRDNCGIIALDALLKSLNLNMNRISLDTLSKICRDNGRLMFPLKVPKDKLVSLGFPFILQTNNHFEIIEDEISLDISDIGEFAYVLYPVFKPEIIPFIIDEEEAKEVKGACDEVKEIPIIGPYLSKPARLIPLAVSAAGQMLNIPAPLTMAASTATGIGQAGTTGLWGKKGAASSLLTGGLQGFGQGLVGRGVGAGLSNVLDLKTATAGNVPGRGGFLTGFKTGFGEAVPFKNVINRALGQQFFPTTYSVKSLNVPGITVTSYGPGLEGWTIPTYLSPKWGGAGAITVGLPTATVAEGAKSNLLPYILLGMGSLIPNPKYNLPSSEDILARYQPTTAEGAAARQKILDYIQNPQNIGGQATTDLLNSLNTYYDDLEKREIAAKRADWEARGYNAFGSDWDKALTDLQMQQRIRRDMAINTIKMQLWQQQLQAQLNAIASAYGVDQQMLHDLINLDIQNAAIKYGLSVEQVAQLRQAIYDLALRAYANQQGVTAEDVNKIKIQLQQQLQ